MRFRVKEPEPTARVRTYDYRINPFTGRRKKLRVRAYRDGKGRPVLTQPIVQGTFFHDGQALDVGDIVESERDLAGAFPERFELLDESEPLTTGGEQ